MTKKRGHGILCEMEKEGMAIWEKEIQPSEEDRGNAWGYEEGREKNRIMWMYGNAKIKFIALYSII